MIFHLSSVDKFRVDTIEEVDDFEDTLRSDAVQQGYELDGFKYDKKVRKQQGEIVDEYYIVTTTKNVQDAKEPFREFAGITYERNAAEVEAVTNFLEEEF